jgi:hypothetical protein
VVVMEGHCELVSRDLGVVESDVSLGCEHLHVLDLGYQLD